MPQIFCPTKYRRLGAVKASQMGRVRLTVLRMSISPTGHSQNFSNQLSQSRIVLLQFLTGIDVVVFKIIFPIGIKPRLHAFGKVLVVIATGVLPFHNPSFTAAV